MKKTIIKLFILFIFFLSGSSCFSLSYYVLLDPVVRFNSSEISPGTTISIGTLPTNYLSLEVGFDYIGMKDYDKNVIARLKLEIYKNIELLGGIGVGYLEVGPDHHFHTYQLGLNYKYPLGNKLSWVSTIYGFGKTDGVYLGPHKCFIGISSGILMKL